MDSDSQQTAGSPPDWARIEEEVRCPLCEYNLRGLTVPRCPECGYRFTWEELRDPSKRLHPYLFEHHPERNVWSFRRTLLGGWNPWRFWRSLHPAQPSDRSRLIKYWRLTVWMYLFPLVLQLCAFVSWVLQTSVWRRARVASWYDTTGGQQELRFLLMKYSSLEAYLDTIVPLPISMKGIWVNLQAEHLPALLLVLVALPVAWPWATYFVLLILRASMRKARIRSHHVLRCVIYAFDGLFYVGAVLLILECVFLATLGEYALPVNLLVPLAWMLPVLGLVGTLRLMVAYRRYLRFDHAFAVVACSQIIVALLALNLAAFCGAIP